MPLTKHFFPHFDKKCIFPLNFLIIFSLNSLKVLTGFGCHSTLVEWEGQRLGQRTSTLYRKNKKVKAI